MADDRNFRERHAPHNMFKQFLWIQTSRTGDMQKAELGSMMSMVIVSFLSLSITSLSFLIDQTWLFPIHYPPFPPHLPSQTNMNLWIEFLYEMNDFY